jgi:predicted transcriptional regulator
MPDVKEIERRRRQFGLTQKELAVRAGVSQSIIAKIESGKISPGYSIVKKLFDVFEEIGKKNEIRAKDILHKDIVFIKRDETVGRAVEWMRKHGYSQLPVIDKRRVIGMISEKTMLDVISTGRNLPEILGKKVEAVMSEAPPIVNENEPISAISSLLQNNQAVLVIKKDKIIGIITKADLFKIANK